MMESSTRLRESAADEVDDRDGAIPRPKRPRRNLHCPHCEETVSKTTYYRHKASYFDENTRKWRRIVADTECDSSDSDTLLFGVDGRDDVGGADDGRLYTSIA